MKNFPPTHYPLWMSPKPGVRFPLYPLSGVHAVPPRGPDQYGDESHLLRSFKPILPSLVEL